LSLRTIITLLLAGQNAELETAHDELYPERIAEHIPLSITLLYPWIPVELLTDADVQGLADFLAAKKPFTFELTAVAEFPGAVVYGVPEPDADLRDLMRSLWARYPDTPPYGERGGDPPPHATLARLDVPPPRTLEGVRERVAGLLPARFVAAEGTLMDEVEPNVWRVRERLPLGNQ
jgi:hypothetical protein